MKKIFQFGAVSLLLILLVALFVSPVSAESEVFWTQSNTIYEKQSDLYQISVNNCGSQLELSVPAYTYYDLYAVKNNNNYGGCPSKENIINYGYDKKVSSSNGKAYMSLESGNWCIVVYARSGSGSYSLKAMTNCPGPYPTYTPTPYPTSSPSLKPYKTDVKSGYLNQGTTAVQGYSIPSGRTFIEWILTGPCGTNVPVTMMSADEVSAMRTNYCNTQYDLYIYKDCNPGNNKCNAQYADTRSSSSAYVGVTNPQVGSTYYAQIYAKQGSGAYTLTCRSYTGQEPVVMMSQPEMSSMMYTATSVEPPV